MDIRIFEQCHHIIYKQVLRFEKTRNTTRKKQKK